MEHDLLKEHFPADRDRVLVMEGLQDTGYWAITWHEKKHPDGGMYRDFGRVKAYLGDGDE